MSSGRKTLLEDLFSGEPQRKMPLQKLLVQKQETLHLALVLSVYYVCYELLNIQKGASLYVFTLVNNYKANTTGVKKQYTSIAEGPFLTPHPTRGYHFLDSCVQHAFTFFLLLPLFYLFIDFWF